LSLPFVFAFCLCLLALPISFFSSYTHSSS
jgi:hypothetical protein